MTKKPRPFKAPFTNRFKFFKDTCTNLGILIFGLGWLSLIIVGFEYYDKHPNFEQDQLNKGKQIIQIWKETLLNEVSHFEKVIQTRAEEKSDSTTSQTIANQSL